MNVWEDCEKSVLGVKDYPLVYHISDANTHENRFKIINLSITVN